MNHILIDSSKKSRFMTDRAAVEPPRKTLKTSPSPLTVPCSSTVPAASISNTDAGSSNMQPFRLLDLPSELRLEIFRVCLTRPCNISMSKLPNVPETVQESTALREESSDIRQPQGPLPVNLLVTCKLIYFEARPVLYGDNVFHINILTAKATLASLHQQSRSLIRSLHILAHSGVIYDLPSLLRVSLRYCFRLKKLILDVAHATDGVRNALDYEMAFDGLRWLNKDCVVELVNVADEEIMKIFKARRMQ